VEGYPQAKKCRPAVESRVLYFGGKELNYKILVKFVQPNRQYFQNKKNEIRYFSTDFGVLD
jgi:hypothetical protein